MLLLLSLVACPLLGQELATDREVSIHKLRLNKEEMKRWVEYYQAEAAEYDIVLGESSDVEPSAKLKLRREPVFRWAAPHVNNEFNGSVFVWTLNGRPEAIGSIWSKSEVEIPGKRTICHSFHSLALGPLHANRNDKTSWHPLRAGIAPKLIPGAALPAASPRLRLTQMRTLARDFTVSQFVGRVETKRQMLRLLPQPIFRYEAETDDSLDGGIFVFLRDWDPEILLLVEIRETPAGWRWHYAPIRFCSSDALVKHKDKEVWAFEKGSPTRDPQHYYFTAKGASYVDRYFGVKDKEQP